MSCTGCNDGCLDSIELAQGEQGLFGGFSGEWRKNSGTSSSVSAGGLTFNNTNMVSATAIYVHQTNIENQNFSNFLNTLTNSSAYGLLRVFQEDDSSKVWYGNLTNVSSSGGVFTLTVTTIQSSLSSGSFTTGKNLVLTFSPKGAAGSAANSGGMVGSEHGTSATSQTVGYANLKNIAITDGTDAQLDTDGDSLEIRARYFYNGTVNKGYPRIILNDASGNIVSLTLHPSGTEDEMDNIFNFMDYDIFLTRNDSTTCSWQLKRIGGSYSLGGSYANEIGISGTGSLMVYQDFESVSPINWDETVTVRFQGKVANAAQEIKLGFGMVKVNKQL